MSSMGPVTAHAGAAVVVNDCGCSDDAAARARQQLVVTTSPRIVDRDPRERFAGRNCVVLGDMALLDWAGTQNESWRGVAASSNVEAVDEMIFGILCSSLDKILPLDLVGASHSTTNAWSRASTWQGRRRNGEVCEPRNKERSAQRQHAAISTRPSERGTGRCLIVVLFQAIVTAGRRSVDTFAQDLSYIQRDTQRSNEPLGFSFAPKEIRSLEIGLKRKIPQDARSFSFHVHHLMSHSRCLLTREAPPDLSLA
jgi:hypothetical protein